MAGIRTEWTLVWGIMAMGAWSFLVAGFCVGETAERQEQSAEDAEGPRPRLFLIGDSTVKVGTPGQVGWGDRLAEHFDTSRIQILNLARGGRSSRTYWTEGLWDQVLQQARPGDFVMMQFGHNDGSPINDTTRARGTLPGIGPETQEIDNLLTGKHEVVHTYGWYMRQYIRQAKDKGMIPIVLSPIPRCPREPVTLPLPEPSSYPLWARQVAEEEGAYFIDLHRIILTHYARMTPQEIKAQFFTEADWTHTSDAGARFNAACVVEGLRGLADCPLKAYLLPGTPEQAAGSGD